MEEKEALILAEGVRKLESQFTLSPKEKKRMESIVNGVLFLLPKVVRVFLDVKKYKFTAFRFSDSPDDDGRHSSEMKLIYLNKTLWRAAPIKRAFTIAHEVAHAFNGDDEIEADIQAVKWLSKYYLKSDLIKLCSYWKPGFKAAGKNPKEKKSK